MKSIINQIKNRQSGFTIVELLVVIVVIGILASITIVAYNGVTARAKTTKAQAMASVVIKKAEGYNGLVGSYPAGTMTATTGFSVASPSDSSSSLQGSGVVFGTITSGTAPANENTIEYIPCTTTSGANAVVSYYNYSTNLKVSQTIGGSCTTAGTAYSSSSSAL